MLGPTWMIWVDQLSPRSLTAPFATWFNSLESLFLTSFASCLGRSLSLPFHRPSWLVIVPVGGGNSKLMTLDSEEEKAEGK